MGGIGNGRAKRVVDDMSGFCRFPDSTGQSHRHCHATWETPSAVVTCVCKCHDTRVLVAKGTGQGSVASRIVAKK